MELTGKFKRIPWDDFKELCFKEEDNLPMESAVISRISDEDGAIDELFDTSSVTIKVGAEKYVISLTVHKE